MTLWHKRALILALVWLVASAGFLAFSLAEDGPAGLIKDSSRRNWAAVFVGSGIALQMVVRIGTRKRADAPVPQVDERDESIHRQSSEIALGLTMAGVFVLCIVLNDTFAETGNVPANWLWFVAWATMAFAHLSQSLVAVVMYTGVFDGKPDHAQG
jgi:hypothetical protein